MRAVVVVVPMLALTCSPPAVTDSSGESSGSASSGSGESGESGEVGESDASESAAESEATSEVGESESGSPCDEPLVECGGECVDVDWTDEHCGACDESCGASQACEYGGCVDLQSWGAIETAAPHGGLLRDGLAVDWELGHVFAMFLGEGKAWGARYDAAADNWEAAQELGPPDFYAQPHALAAGGGRAALIWNHEVEQGDHRLFLRSYDDATGWGGPEPLGVPGVQTSVPSVAINAAGEGHVIWRDFGPERADWRRWGSANANWDPPTGLASNEVGRWNFFVATADDGDATALSVDETQLLAFHYSAADDAWSPPEVVDPELTWFFDGPVSVQDAAGNILTVYHRSVEPYELVFRRFDVSAGTWTDLESLDPDPTLSHMLMGLSANPEGDVVATWTRMGGAASVLGHYDLESNTWSVETELPGYWGPVLDANGKVHFAVTDADIGSLTTHRFRLDLGTWADPVVHAQDAALGSSGGQLVADADGRVTLVWSEQVDGVYQVRARRWE